MNEPTIETNVVLQEGDQPNESELNLASRWRRLGAAMLDSAVMALFTVPMVYVTGGFDMIAEGVEPSLANSLAMGILSLVLFLLINFKLLKDKGQTIGKKCVGIKIVNLAGGQATWGKNLSKRYATFLIPGQIPVIGSIFSLVNVLFVFGKKKRCIHDYAGSTQVVKC